MLWLQSLGCHLKAGCLVSNWIQVRTSTHELDESTLPPYIWSYNTDQGPQVASAPYWNYLQERQPYATIYKQSFTMQFPLFPVYRIRELFAEYRAAFGTFPSLHAYLTILLFVISFKIPWEDLACSRKVTSIACQNRVQWSSHWVAVI